MTNMIRTTVHLCRKSEGQIVIVRVVKRYVRVGYVKAITKKCTTSEATELGVLRTCQLGLLVVQKIDVYNLNGLNIWT